MTFEQWAQGVEQRLSEEVAFGTDLKTALEIIHDLRTIMLLMDFDNNGTYAEEAFSLIWERRK